MGVAASDMPYGDSRSVTGGALSIKNVGKVYDPEGDHVVALEGVSLEIPSGQFCAVVGPSGCGKTTLLNMLAGFERSST